MADKVVRIFDLGMEYKGKRGAAAKGDGARAALQLNRRRLQAQLTGTAPATARVCVCAPVPPKPTFIPQRTTERRNDERREMTRAPQLNLPPV